MLDGSEQASSADSRDAVAAALAKVDGWTLGNFAVEPQSGRSRLDFGGQTTIETWPADGDARVEQWFVYSGRDVLAYRADGMFTIVTGDTPANRERWQELG